MNTRQFDEQGKRHGEWKVFHKGNLYTLKNYQNGVLNGVHEIYNLKTGEPEYISEKRNWSNVDLKEDYTMFKAFRFYFQ